MYLFIFEEFVLKCPINQIICIKNKNKKKTFIYSQMIREQELFLDMSPYKVYKFNCIV